MQSPFVTHVIQLMLEKTVFLKRFVKISSLTLIKMPGLNIVMSQEIVQKAKTIVQNVMYNRNLNENFVQVRVRLY